MALIIRQSRIHSHGCYTTRPIRKGTLIIEYVGLCLSYEQADDLYDDFPNTDQIKGKMWIIALRDIAAGEELTYDYNLFDGEDDAPCLCGAKTCRGSLYSPSHLRKLAKKRAKAAAASA